MFEEPNDPCLISPPVHVLCLQTNRWKLTKLKAMWAKVSLGYCKII